MIVCQCKRVSDRKIARSVKGGCESLKSVCLSTGAGGDCGTCVRTIKCVVTDLLAKKGIPAQSVVSHVPATESEPLSATA